MTRIKITNQNDFKKRLDNFLVEFFENSLNCSRAKIASILADGEIFLVNNVFQKASYKLKENDVIEFDDDKLNTVLNPDKRLKKYDFKLDIVYEDNDVLVINKPKEMLTHPTKFDNEKTLVNALLNYCPDTLSDILGPDRLGIVHRLDKNTSGLMLVAKNNFSHTNLANQIKEKTAKRKYLAIALGNFKEPTGIIDKPLIHYLKNDVKMVVSDDSQGLSATTIYRVIESFLGASLVELELKTGRTHQIRAHLASINHPLFGDNLYGAKGFLKKEFSNLKTIDQLLQSYYLSFYHPKTNELMEFELKEEDFSKDFIKVLNFLRNNYKE